MEFSTIDFLSEEYKEMVVLRDKILREPIGLMLTEKDKTEESDDTFCICKEKDILCGCCILTKEDDLSVRLRQMAVDTSFQGKGVGAALLDFAEQIVRERKLKHISLHARISAKDFYAKYGYKVRGGIFKEVGLDHVEMYKDI